MAFEPQSEGWRRAAEPETKSRFEQPIFGPLGPKGRTAAFAPALQKLFPVPNESSEPEEFRILRQRIAAELNRPAGAGTGAGGNGRCKLAQPGGKGLAHLIPQQA